MKRSKFDFNVIKTSLYILFGFLILGNSQAQNTSIDLSAARRLFDPKELEALKELNRYEKERTSYKANEIEAVLRNGNHSRREASKLLQSLANDFKYQIFFKLKNSTDSIILRHSDQFIEAYYELIKSYVTNAYDTKLSTDLVSKLQLLKIEATSKTFREFGRPIQLTRDSVNRPWLSPHTLFKNKYHYVVRLFENLLDAEYFQTSLFYPNKKVLFNITGYIKKTVLSNYINDYHNPWYYISNDDRYLTKNEIKIELNDAGNYDNTLTTSKILFGLNVEKAVEMILNELQAYKSEADFEYLESLFFVHTSKIYQEFKNSDDQRYLAEVLFENFISYRSNLYPSEEMDTTEFQVLKQDLITHLNTFSDTTQMKLFLLQPTLWWLEFEDLSVDHLNTLNNLTQYVTLMLFSDSDKEIAGVDITINDPNKTDPYKEFLVSTVPTKEISSDKLKRVYLHYNNIISHFDDKIGVSWRTSLMYEASLKYSINEAFIIEAIGATELLADYELNELNSLVVALIKSLNGQLGDYLIDKYKLEAGLINEYEKISMNSFNFSHEIANKFERLGGSMINDKFENNAFRIGAFSHLTSLLYGGSYVDGLYGNSFENRIAEEKFRHNMEIMARRTGHGSTAYGMGCTTKCFHTAYHREFIPATMTVAYNLKREVSKGLVGLVNVPGHFIGYMQDLSKIDANYNVCVQGCTKNSASRASIERLKVLTQTANDARRAYHNATVLHARAEREVQRSKSRLESYRREAADLEEDLNANEDNAKELHQSYTNGDISEQQYNLENSTLKEERQELETKLKETSDKQEQESKVLEEKIKKASKEKEKVDKAKKDKDVAEKELKEATKKEKDELLKPVRDHEQPGPPDPSEVARVLEIHYWSDKYPPIDYEEKDPSSTSLIEMIIHGIIKNMEIVKPADPDWDPLGTVERIRGVTMEELQKYNPGYIDPPNPDFLRKSKR